VICFACRTDLPAHSVRMSPVLSISFCCACGSGRADGPPQRETLTAIYREDYYKAWGLHDVDNCTESLKRATFSQMLQQCSRWMRDGGKILDLGCATGFFLREAHQRGFEGFGVDVSAYAIDRCAATIDRTRLYCGEFQSSPFGEESEHRFDAIFMSDYLEHVHDPAAVLALAAERLAPSGVVVITTPDVSSVSRRIMGRRWPHFKPEHVSYYSGKGMIRALHDSGLALVAGWSTRKALSIRYVLHQFTQYPNPWITSWLAPLFRVLPSAIADAHPRVTTGELTVVARRQP
jgi:2-polyprenyl-3-methyl-5-hydroxy-6-metoxy-1,4-benzoquinol methylase